MKILISDPLAREAVEMLEGREGFKVDVKTELAPEELVASIGNYDALVVRSATKVTEDVIKAGKNLKLIARAGVSLSNIDLKAAKAAGIPVVSTPAASSISVAELTIAHLLALSRHIPQGTASLKAGKWEKKMMMGMEVFGKTLGIIGTGRIGREVAKRAHALGMEVLGYDPFVTKEDLAGVPVEMASLNELLKTSDYITLHLPLTEKSRHLLGKTELEKVKEGVRIINCSQGGVVDEEALYEALLSKRVTGAALDVFEREPPKSNKLFELDSVIATPHIGASTVEAQYRVGIEVAQKVIEHLSKWRR